MKTAKHFLVRSWRSTSVLAFMIFSAVATMVFLSALATGTNDAMIRNSVGLFTGHIIASNIYNKIPIKSFHGKEVKAVLKRQIVYGLLTYGSTIKSVQLTGVNPEDEVKYTGLWKKVIRGDYLKGTNNEIVLGFDTAAFLKVKVGDRVTFSANNMVKKEYSVKGIFKTGLSTFDNEIVFCVYAGLPEKPKSWSAAIFLKEGSEVESVIKTFKSRLLGGDFLSWKQMMPDLKQLIDLNNICMGLLNAIVFTIVSIGISCAFMIFVLKNLNEYGIMKTMGLSTAETIFLIINEVFMMIFFAATIGVLTGALLVYALSGPGIDISAFTSHNKYFIISGEIFPRLTIESLLYPPLMSLIICMLAAIWPAYTVSTNKITKVLKSL
jgi:ABC-type lipoprotein release transport system permease subunit